MTIAAHRAFEVGEGGWWVVNFVAEIFPETIKNIV